MHLHLGWLYIELVLAIAISDWSEGFSAGSGIRKGWFSNTSFTTGLKTLPMFRPDALVSFRTKNKWLLQEMTFSRDRAYSATGTRITAASKHLQVTLIYSVCFRTKKKVVCTSKVGKQMTHPSFFRHSIPTQWPIFAWWAHVRWNIALDKEVTCRCPRSYKQSTWIT